MWGMSQNGAEATMEIYGVYHPPIPCPHCDRGAVPDPWGPTMWARCEPCAGTGRKGAGCPDCRGFGVVRNLTGIGQPLDPPPPNAEPVVPKYRFLMGCRRCESTGVRPSEKEEALWVDAAGPKSLPIAIPTAPLAGAIGAMAGTYGPEGSGTR